MTSLSISAIFAAGVLTFASPCVLPLIPIYLATLAGSSLEHARPRRTLLVASAFALGLSLVFIALGALSSSVGALLLEHRLAVTVTSGVLMLLFGARALGLLRVRGLERDSRPGLTRVRTVSSVLGAFLFGAAFALGWSPCIGPVLAAVLTHTALHADTPMAGAAYLAVYAAGLSLPLLVLAAFAARATAWIRRASGAIPTLEKLTGAALVAVGVWTLGGVIAERPLTGEARGAAVAARVPPLGDHGSCDADAPGHTCALPDAPTVKGAAEHVVSLPGRAQLIEFGAHDCPVCRRMRPVVDQLVSACTELDAHVVHVDVATASGRALADRHNVRGTPTFVMLDERGQEKARLLGENTSEAFGAALERAFGVSCWG
jgi:cytochrome c-type biogenesis protein